MALLVPANRRDVVTERRVAAIVAAVRRDGDRALLRYAKRFDPLEGPIEVTEAEMRSAAASVPRPVRAAIRAAARNIRTVARRQVPKGWRAQVAPGVTVEQRIVPLDRVGCYVPGGRYPLPSSLLMTAIPAKAAGVAEVIVVCPRPDPVVMAAALEAGISRLFRIGGAHAVAALAYGTATVPRVDKIVGPGNRYVAAAKALVASDCGIDFYAGPSEIVIVSSRGPAGWIAADLIAQAEHDPDARAVLITPSRALATRVAREVAARMPAEGPARQSLRAHGGIIVTTSADEAMELANLAAPEHLVVDDERQASKIRCAGSVFVGRVVGPGRRRLCLRFEPRAAHVWRSEGARRALLGGLRATDHHSTRHAVRPAANRRHGDDARHGRRAEGARGVHRDQGDVMVLQGYPSPGEGLRLHLNENTGGCSDRVLEAIRQVRPSDVSTYPQYREAVDATAQHFGVNPDWVLLTNGLDEGILMAAVGHIAKARVHDAETIIPQPAFDPYPNSTMAVGAKAVWVPPGPDFAFPTQAVIDAVTPRTRMIFLNTPNNPTGQLIAIDRPRSHLRGSAPRGGAHRRGLHRVRGDDVSAAASRGYPNVLLGRTFSKAYGLAGLRVGVVIGQPRALDPVRSVTLPFNINGIAMTAMQAALRGHRVPAPLRSAGQGLSGVAVQRVPSPRTASSGRVRPTT